MIMARKRGEMPGGKGRLNMQRRLWFSVALIAVLFCFWLVMSKPICRDGFSSSLDPRAGWTCVANGK